MSEPERRNYFRDLYELGSDPSATLGRKIEQAITIGRDRLGVDYGVLSYTGHGEYEVVDSTIESGEFRAGTIHDLETTWCRHVVDGREVLTVADAGASAYSDDIAREATCLQCYVGAPVRVDGDIYGTLCFSSETPREEPFDEDEQRFVELLTRWIGHEIERERHYQALDAQNERLDEFAGMLAHDLRNPLTTAYGYTELVAETVDDPESGYLGTALDSLDRMETLIADTLSLARDGVDVGERESVQLSTVARTAWKTVDPATATLTVVDDRTIHADESRLRQAVREPLSQRRRALRGGRDGDGRRDRRRVRRRRHRPGATGVDRGVAVRWRLHRGSARARPPHRRTDRLRARMERGGRVDD